MSAKKFRIDIGVATVTTALITAGVTLIIHFSNSNTDLPPTGTSEVESHEPGTSDVGSHEPGTLDVVSHEPGTLDVGSHGPGTLDVVSHEPSTPEVATPKGSTDAGIVTDDEDGRVIITNNNVFTHEFGKIELTDDHSGIAYIYKDYIDYYAIGSSIDGLTISGLDIGLNSGDESFQLFVYANKYNGHTIECSAQYYINGIFQYNFSELPSFFITNSGDLQIEFSCKEIPFDLRDSSEITIGHSIEV